MRNVRILRFVTRRRLKWVAVIAAGLCAALFVSTLWISPGFIVADSHYAFWVDVDRGRVDAVVLIDDSSRTYQRITATSIDKHSPTGFDLWFLIEREPVPSSNPLASHTRLVVPLWFPFVVCAAAAFYLRRTDPPEPWQCAACRYDLRGLETNICPECGKQSECAS